jgi:hypothetical protein
VLHHRKHNVLKNAFEPDACQAVFGVKECSYTPGQLSDTKVVETPFGRTAILVCADAYPYDPASLQALKAQSPEFVIIPWGITAGTQAQCGAEGFNATGFAAEAAKYLGTAYVVGAKRRRRTALRSVPSVLVLWNQRISDAHGGGRGSR